MIQKKATVKSKKLGSIVKSVPKSIGEVKFMKDKPENSKSNEPENQSEETKKDKPIKYSVLTLDNCKKGINKGGVFVGKLI
jgi:Sec-independent protein translocase protein TatA